MIIRKLNAECQSKVICRSFPFYRILIVTHILSSSMPSFTKLLCFDFRIHKRSHSMIIKTVRFQQVYYIKSVSPIRSCILNPEVIPLSVTSCVIVWLQYQIIFKLIHLNSSSQISTLKSRFKNQSIVLLSFGLVIWNEDLIIVTLIWTSFVYFSLFFSFQIVQLLVFAQFLLWLI